MTWASDRVLASIVALSLLGASPVIAAPTAQEKETARQLVKSGRDKKKSGDVAAALDDFKAAHAIMDVPTTGLELGKAQIEARRWVEARDTLLAVARSAPAPRESPVFAKARTEAKALAKDLEPKIPQLTLELEHAPPGVRVLVDDAEIAPAALSSPLALNPGKHVVRATLAAREERAEVELDAGQTRKLSMDLSKLADPKGRKRKTEQVAATSSGTSPWVYVGFGVAGAGVLVGGVTGALALSKGSTVDEGCVDARCPPSTHDDIDSGRILGNVSTVAFIVAAVGAGIGGVALLSSGKEKAAPKVQAWVAPGSAGLRGRF